jgi:hypothetical protein
VDAQPLTAVQADLRFTDIDRELVEALVPPVELDVRHSPLVAARDEVAAIHVPPAGGQTARKRAEDLDRWVVQAEADEVRWLALEQVLE